jgi:parallel beta-helix repeat protein
MAAVSVTGTSEPTISGNSLADNNMAISWATDGGLIEHNTVEGGRAGIIIGGGSPIVRDNTVEGVEGRGIVVAFGASPILSGNTSCGNGENLVVVVGATPEDDDTNEFCPDTPDE